MATETQVELPIQGMSCTACATRIEQGLGTLPGVKTATVNFATERASVTYDAAGLDIDRIVTRVRELGYEIPCVVREPGRDSAPEGKTPAFLAADGRVRGLIAVADVLKPDAASTIAALLARIIRECAVEPHG